MPPRRRTIGILWGAFALVLLGVPVAALLARSKKAVDLPRYGTVPDFRLVDQDDRPFGLAELRGNPWVADFIFTSCSAACPRLTGAMLELENHLINRGEALRTRLVSITVDPARDTPAKLRDYAATIPADGRKWKFLTGPTEKVEDAVVKGFKQGIDREKSADADDFTILHGTKMVLVDGNAEIRGFFDANDGADMARLREAISVLLEQGSP